MADRLAPKYATFEDSIVEVKESKTRLPYVHDAMPGANLAKFAKMDDTPLGDGEDGYVYVRARAISSRVNKNNDGWPAEELAKSYKTFIGRPIFVDHNNDDPRRTRGVIIDSHLIVEDEKTSALDPYYATAPQEHLPPTIVEILMEVDAKTYPELAKDLRAGRVNATSMGANIERSVCSVCKNEATAPSQYCSHVQQKGAEFEIEADNGEKIHRKAYEDCYGINFFEDSFVFDPADETALITEHVGKVAGPGVNEPAVDDGSRKRNYVPQSDMTTAPQEVDTLRDEMKCKNCEADNYQEDSDGIMRCPTCGSELEPPPLDNPDLSKAKGEEEAAQPNDDAATQQITFDDQPAGQGTSDDFIKPIEPIKSSGTTEGIDEMKFETRVTTNSKEEADKELLKTAGSTQTNIEFAGGIHGGTMQLFQQAGITAEVTYPDGTTLPLPGPPMQHLGKQIQLVRSGEYASPGEIPVTVTAPDDQLQQAVEFIHDGGMGARGAAITKKVLNQGKKEPASTPKDQKIVSDQDKPVTSKLTVQDDEETMKEADRRKIHREESPDGTRVEDIVEESGELEFSEGEKPNDETPEEPVAEEKDEKTKAEEEEEENVPVAAAVSPEKKLLEAFALADEAVEMNLIPKEEKLAFVAKLEDETSEQIASRRDMLELTKSAGLVKREKIAALRGLPRVAATTESNNGSFNLDDVPDAAIFLS
jgi:hypothetical protein